VGQVIQGTGLGLHITRGLVQAHHGHIWAESQVGAGSTFHVWLPVRQPLPSQLEQPELVSRIAQKYFED
jgi:signal transduction histidine kinase